MPAPLRLAVFDCDGTLIDSQRNIIRAMADSFARHELAPPEDHATRRVVGLSLVEAMQALLPDAEPRLHLSLANDYKTAFQRLRADRQLEAEPLYKGIRPLLDDLAAAGWLLAVATGKSDRGLALALAHHGIANHFISLQTADRHPSKPHPSMLHAALADAGAEPQQAVIIGDTVFDVLMGVNAGVRALGVDWGYHDAAELHDAGAAAVARDPAELWTLLHETA
ncbi:HAD-IA family hydrolase [Polymorphobacter sp.]|uniref:HAD-IA family hydrolase n=1 Tax=Polymorphobacter sp. TaxID=1909290 RepID=UPI003F6F25E0